jgi:hypothetical protein
MRERNYKTLSLTCGSSGLFDGTRVASERVAAAGEQMLGAAADLRAEDIRDLLGVALGDVPCTA